MRDLPRLEKVLAELADPERAAHSSRFFKTGKGQYGEGDQFLGIRVPQLRALIKQYPDLPIQDILELICSPFHEKRLLAALMLVYRFQRSDWKGQEEIYRLYLDHLGTHINNWDIIDTTCPHIMGAWLYGRDRSVLYIFENGFWSNIAKPCRARCCGMPLSALIRKNESIIWILEIQGG